MTATSKQHTDREYEAELREVRERLLRMAGCVERMIADAARALVEGDLELAQRTIEADETVDSLEVETDEMCLLMLAKRQPLASDLRMITLAMKMVTDLERIGDLAVNISERTMALRSEPRPPVADKIARMAEFAQMMIREAIDAFINRDADRARRVFVRDEEVDDLYREITDGVQLTMHDEPDYVERGVHLNAVAKFLERIADHGTNLAELVVFLVEGKDVRHKPYG
ncbi:phosphate signaling complex protein PhoU [Haliangium sp.]|uniref:phosphate signaling complex protein PhoU n=1 Tax=Haliangium sp. TaxID=2663208 RepID=UPI003D10CBB6